MSHVPVKVTVMTLTLSPRRVSTRNWTDLEILESILREYSKLGLQVSLTYHSQKPVTESVGLQIDVIFRDCCLRKIRDMFIGGSYISESRFLVEDPASAALPVLGGGSRSSPC